MANKKQTQEAINNSFLAMTQTTKPKDQAAPKAADPAKDQKAPEYVPVTKRDYRRGEKQDKSKFYKFNLSLPVDLKEYVVKAAFFHSEPMKACTITDYITMLIEQDYQKNSKKIEAFEEEQQRMKNEMAKERTRNK